MKCQKVIEETRQIMKLLGIEDERLHLKWISASEGSIFAQEILGFTQQLTRLGKLGLGVVPEREQRAQDVAGQGAGAAASETTQMASA